MLLSEIAQKINARIHYPEGFTKALDPEILGILPAAAATEQHITFLTNPKFRQETLDSKASAVLTCEELPGAEDKIQLILKDPYSAMAAVSQMFFTPTHGFQGQSPLAFVHKDARVSPTATLYPFAYVGARATIGDGVVLYPHVYVGEDAQIDQDCVLYPGVVIMQGVVIGRSVVVHGSSVIGADGFGYAPTSRGLVKIPQTGRVRIEDHCEIGSLANIDRATFQETLIKHGAKIDSMVHVGHNVEVGEHAVLCGQVGVSGSAKIGPGAMLGGQVGVFPGVNIAQGARIAGMAGVQKDIERAGDYGGFPAIPAKEWMRQVIALKKLSEILRHWKVGGSDPKAGQKD